MKGFDKLVYLLTVFLSGYVIIFGIDNHTQSQYAAIFYTIAFGVILLTSMLLMLGGNELFANNFLSIIATVIPISLSIGLTAENCKSPMAYGITVIALFIIAILIKYFSKGKLSLLSLGIIHLISGSIIVFMPIFLVLYRGLSGSYVLFSLGGMILGTVGTIIALDKMGVKNKYYGFVSKYFSLTLLMATFLFVLGIS